jgi:toxin ParE1/3/4
MAPKLVWRPQARADLLALYLDIGQEQPRAAERYFDTIEARRRPDIAASARMLVERPFLILYETEPNTDEGAVQRVRIVRVVDGRRELSGVFTA